MGTKKIKPPPTPAYRWWALRFPVAVYNEEGECVSVQTVSIRVHAKTPKAAVEALSESVRVNGWDGVYGDE